MADSEFLSAEEVRDLTGRRRCDAQRRELDYMGIPYRTRSDGTPSVLRMHVVLTPGANIGAPREPELHL